jgi:hypothetical protein
MYAYSFGRLSEAGLDVLGASQLAGVPATPEWNISNPQYPSVSLLNYTTGEGNARYWVLKMMIDEFRPGDIIVRSERPPAAAGTTFCGDTWNIDTLYLGYPKGVTVRCEGGNNFISRIEEAYISDALGDCSVGFTPRNLTCSDKGQVLTYAQSMCEGQTECTIDIGSFNTSCPVSRLVVKAKCALDGGVAQPAGRRVDQVYVQGRITALDGNKVLIVNKNNNATTIDVSQWLGGTAVIVDDYHPTRTVNVSESKMVLKPFAVVVIKDFSDFQPLP